PIRWVQEMFFSYWDKMGRVEFIGNQVSWVIREVRQDRLKAIISISIKKIWYQSPKIIAIYLARHGLGIFWCCGGQGVPCWKQRILVFYFFVRRVNKHATASHTLCPGALYPFQ
ncbi:MAG: hypothetical protein DRG63_10660, partial [Deltaproteobacteria bacterium]